MGDGAGWDSMGRMLAEMTTIPVKKLKEENENLKLLVACLLVLHVQRGFGERSAAFAISQLTEKFSEDGVRNIFRQSKEVFEKFAK